MNEEQRLAIHNLYLEIYQKLKLYALSKLKNEDLAEEAVQEAFGIACRKPEQLLSNPNPPGWMMNTVKYVVIGILREQESSRKLLSNYLLSMSTAVTFTEDRVSLDVLYENLADREEFALIKELAIDGKSHLEMALARGISVDACKKRVQRAKEILRKKSKNNCHLATVILHI